MLANPHPDEKTATRAGGVAVLFEALLPDQNAGTTAPLYFSVMKSLIS